MITTEEVRARCCNRLAKLRGKVEGAVEGGWAAYMRRMRKDAWADAVMLKVAAVEFGLTFRVFSSIQSFTTSQLIDPLKGEEAGEEEQGLGQMDVRGRQHFVCAWRR